MMRIVMRTLGAFAVGLVLCVFVLQNNNALQERVGRHIVTFLEKEWKASITLDAPTINFFTFSLYLKNFKVAGADHKKYQWHSDECRIHIAPLPLLFKKRAELHITINNITSTTQKNGNTIDALDHLKDIFAQKMPNFDVAPKTITINNLDTKIHDGANVVWLRLPGTIFAEKNTTDKTVSKNDWDVTARCNQGVIARNDKPLVTNLTGVTAAGFIKKQGWLVHNDYSFKTPLIDTGLTYTYQSTHDNNGGTLTLTEPTKKLQLASTFSFPFMLGLKGHLPLEQIIQAVYGLQQGSAAELQQLAAVNGICAFDMVIVPKEKTIQTTGRIDIAQLNVGGFNLDHIALNVGNNASGSASSAGIDVMSRDMYNLSGDLNWDWEKNCGSLKIANQEIIMPHIQSSAHAYTIDPNDLQVMVQYDATGCSKGTYSCKLHHQTLGKKYNYDGAVLVKNKKISLKGTTAKGTYDIRGAFAPHPHLTKWVYTVADKNVIDLKTTISDPLTLNGTVRWSLFRSMLDRPTRRMLFGDNCVFGASINQHDLSHLAVEANLEQGNFFIPEYHNLITGCHIQGTFDRETKRLTLNDGTITLNKGSISCPQARIIFNNSFGIESAHIPLQVNDMFVNMHRDLFALVYGNVLFDKTVNKDPFLSGTVVIKKALLKDASVFAQRATNDLPFTMPMALGCNVNVITEKPVSIRTPFIDTAATLDLCIKNSPADGIFAVPKVTGTIDLHKGSLKFLDKKLYIDYGKLQFLANNLNDPIVDLIAKNRLNQYMVTMQATGSIQKPTIILESSPDLSEEQIIGLLTTGSEHSSLQAGMSSLFANFLLDGINGSSRNKKSTTGILNAVSKTFKYVRLSPTINEKTSVGGVKGSLSLSLNDQLRAKIEKDFDLQKNLRQQGTLQSVSAQLEYLVADNINLRIMKEEHDELGAEIEFSLKL
jgi:hypothetical protein